MCVSRPAAASGAVLRPRRRAAPARHSGAAATVPLAERVLRRSRTPLFGVARPQSAACRGWGGPAAPASRAHLPSLFFRSPCALPPDLPPRLRRRLQDVRERVHSGRGQRRRRRCGRVPRRRGSRGPPAAPRGRRPAPAGGGGRPGPPRRNRAAPPAQLERAAARRSARARAETRPLPAHLRPRVRHRRGWRPRDVRQLVPGQSGGRDGRRRRAVRGRRGPCRRPRGAAAARRGARAPARHRGAGRGGGGGRQRREGRVRRPPFARQTAAAAPCSLNKTRP